MWKLRLREIKHLSQCVAQWLNYESQRWARLCLPWGLRTGGMKFNTTVMLSRAFVFGGRDGVLNSNTGGMEPVIPFTVKKGWEPPCICWLWWQRCSPSASAASVSPTNQTFQTQCISFFCFVTLAHSLLHMPLLSCGFLLCVFSTSLSAHEQLSCIPQAENLLDSSDHPYLCLEGTWVPGHSIRPLGSL